MFQTAEDLIEGQLHALNVMTQAQLAGQFGSGGLQQMGGLNDSSNLVTPFGPSSHDINIFCVMFQAMRWGSNDLFSFPVGPGAGQHMEGQARLLMDDESVIDWVPFTPRSTGFLEMVPNLVVPAGSILGAEFLIEEETIAFMQVLCGYTDGAGT